MKVRDARAQLLQFDDQLVNLCNERFAARMRTVGDQFRRMLGQPVLARKPSPTTNLAVGQQCKPTQVAAPACVLQVTEKVLESELQRCG